MTTTEKKQGPLLDEDSPDMVRMTVDEATTLGADALKRLGYTDEEAGIITGHLIDSALCGYKFAGLPRILAISKSARVKKGRQPIRIVQETPVSASVDGGNNVGYLTAWHGSGIGIEKAKAMGMSAVGVHNTFYSGRGAYYVERMVKEGLAVICAASAQPKVLAPGAMDAVMGTNPICIGFPSQEGPIVYDIGTAAIMGGELSLYGMLGKMLPEGIAFDTQGRPTQDPNEAQKGGVVPFGGHKGYGLAFCVQGLGLLAGAVLARGTVKDYGMLFIAIRPDVLLPPGKYEEHVSMFVRELKGTRRQPGVDEIRVPFERSVRERERRLVEGIVLDRAVGEALKNVQG